MADETVKLILQLENKAKKDFNILNKEIKNLKNSSDKADDSVGKLDKEIKETGSSSNKTKNDLGKLDKEVKKVGNSSKKTSKGLDEIGNSLKTIGGFAAGAAAGISAIAFQASTSARELQALADIAGLNVNEFGNLSAAYESFGVTADGLSSVLKDITERVDDAVFNNAGEFIDVAKQLNIELESLNAKSAGEQLEFLIDKLNKLDPNRARSIADRLGGDELIKIEASYRRLGNEASKLVSRVNELDFQLSEEELKSINAVRTEFDLLFKNIGSLLTQRFAVFFEGSEESVAGINDEITKLRNGNSDILKFISNTGDNFGATFDNISQGFKQIGLEGEAFAAKVNLAFNSIFGDSEKALQDYVKEIGNLQDSFDNSNDIQFINGLLKENIALYNGQLAGITELSKGQEQLVKNRLSAIRILKEENLSIEDQGEALYFLINSYKGNVSVQRELAAQYDRLTEAMAENNKENIMSVDISKQSTKQIEKQIKAVKKLENVDFKLDNDFLDILKNAQLELLRLEGSFREAFDIDIKPTELKIEKLKEKLKEANDLITNKNADKSTIDNAKKFKNELDFLERKIALQRELTTQQTQDFELGELNEDETEANQQFDLGIIDEEAFIEKLEIIKEALRGTFGEDSIEFQSFSENLEKVKNELDEFGQISLMVFDKFSEGFATAVTDSLLYGKSLRDGLSSVIQSIIQQLIQAAIQALIFSAILKATGMAPPAAGGGSQSFGEMFKTNFAGNLGVPTRHNGGSVGKSGDSANSIRNINLSDPSKSLNSNERLIIAKTDESVIDTQSLTSPTGVGSNEVKQPQVNISNYITDDVMNAYLQSDSAEDTIITIMNRNSDKIR
jgi:hypothetical protein